MYVIDTMASRCDVIAKMTANKFHIKLLILCLNVILPITVFLYASKYVPCPSSPNESQSVIRSTEESLYVMYGEGDFTDSDEHLLNYIRSMTSQQVPGRRRLSSKSSRVEFSQHGGSGFVDELLKQRRNGFFVECGAFGGEELSDTLFFEIKRNWTGLLIEAHPEYHRNIGTY